MNVKELQLKYYAYCCYQAGSLMYIGGMNFIQVLDQTKLEIVRTINAGKLIYKMLPLDCDHFICCGSYILDLLRLTDHKMVEVCRFETSIYDMAPVAEIGRQIGRAHV